MFSIHEARDRNGCAFARRTAAQRATTEHRGGAIRGLTDDLLRTGTINVMLETYQKRLAESGSDARLQEIAEQLAEDPNEAESAFALAAAVALADDEVSDDENTFINRLAPRASRLAEWFGISAPRAAEILDQLERIGSRPSELFASVTASTL